MVVRREIGLQFDNCVITLFLNTGIIFAILNASGNIPVSNIWFIINVNERYISFLINFNILFEIPSTPLLLFILEIIDNF